MRQLTQPEFPPITSSRYYSLSNWGSNNDSKQSDEIVRLQLTSDFIIIARAQSSTRQCLSNYSLFLHWRLCLRFRIHIDMENY